MNLSYDRCEFSSAHTRLGPISVFRGARHDRESRDGGAHVRLKCPGVHEAGSTPDLDAALAVQAVPPNVRVRLLQAATSAVMEDEKGELAVGMTTTLVFEDLDAGTSKAFDIEIRGAIDADDAYRDDMPIFIEGWRRVDGKPIENRTKANRSFWGALSGRFEP